jgi:hypothetical protein
MKMAVRTAVALFALAAGACEPAWDPRHPRAGGPPPPRSLAPGDGEVVSGARPLFRWRLPRGVDGAELAICADRDCKKSVATVAAQGESATPPEDLPSGIYWWRLRAVAGGTPGWDWSPPVRLVLERKIGLAGRYVDVIMPEEQRALAERLVALGDRAIAYYSELLGRPLPDGHARVYFYLTMDELHDIELQWAGRRQPNHFPAYTMRGVGSHILLVPNVHRAQVDAPGHVEATLLHELAHAFEQKRVLLYHDQPPWLREGLADLLSEEALTPEHLPVVDRNDLLADRLHGVRRALDNGQFLHLDRLLDADDRLVREVNAGTWLFYSEAFSLMHFLDSPANPGRRAKLHAFIREVAAMRGFAAGFRIRRLFEQTFGDVPSLEREWIASVRADRVFPWSVRNAELRPLPDGGLLLESMGARRRGFALDTREAAGGGTRLEATVALGDGDAQQVELVFGHRGEDHLCGVSFFDDGRVSLWQIERGGFKVRTSSRRSPNPMVRGAAHRLTVDLAKDEVWARVDGREVLDVLVPEEPRGLWGFGTWDGRATFRDVKAGPIPREPPTPGPALAH